MTVDAVLIAGPTASGKSEAALALAERIGGAIINADSMQVYAEAPILTAQPTAADRARAPHHLYGHVSAREVYSVGRWRDDAMAALEKLEGRTPIFVGGTGMYFMALTEGLADIPATPAGNPRRGARAADADRRGSAARPPGAARSAYRGEAAAQRSAARAARLGSVRSHRPPAADWQETPAAPVLKGRTLAFVLDPPRPLLRAHIAARFEAMVEQGGLAEAVALTGLDPALPAAKLLGLAPLQGLAAGALSKARRWTPPSPGRGSSPNAR